MKTFTQLQSMYLNLTRDRSAQNVSQGQIFINDSVRTICNLQGGKLRFLEATKDMVTVADQESYLIPNGFRKLMDIMIYSGDGTTSDQTIYSPEMVFDPFIWKNVLQYRLGSADTPYFTYVENQRYKIQPIPSTDGNLIRLRGRLQTSDLSQEDYTSGCVSAIALGGTTVTGSTNAFNANIPGINNFSVDIPTASPFTGDSETTSTVPFETDASIATQFNTLTSGTCADYGITNAKAIVYTGPSHDNYVNGTTYYAGNISGNTFKIYSDVTLLTLVVITIDTSGYTWSTDGGPRVTMISPATTAAQGIANGVEVIYTGSTANGLVNGQAYWAGNVTTTKFKLYNDSSLTTATTVTGATNPAAFDMQIDPVATLTSGTCAGFGIVSGSPVTYTGSTAGGLVHNTVYYAGNISTDTFVLYSDSGLTSPLAITSDVTAGTFNIAITPPIATLTSGTTASVGITNGSAVVYTGSTANGLVNGTTYYAGSVGASTFKVYTDADLSTAVTLTGNVVAGAFSFQSVQWTSAMAGQYIQIAQNDTSNGGDGFWYQIESVTNATTLELVKPYEGGTISGSCVDYTIGQCSVIPEAYDMAILYRAVALYWQLQDDLQRAQMYWVMYDGGNELGKTQEYGGLIGQMLANEGETEEGSYLPPPGTTQNMPNAPYYFPFQDASGFN